jgi:hypothetical protein
VPAVKFKDTNGKTVTAPLTRSGDRCRVSSPVWYGQYTDADGGVQREPLCENKAAAEQMLNDLVRKAALGKAGIRDPFEHHHKRPRAEQLVDWEAFLHADGNAEKHVKQTVACVRRILDGCQFVFIADLSASAVQQFLASLRQKGRRAFRPLDPAREWWTKKELADILGVKPTAIPSLVKRHRLTAVEEGKARRFPLAMAEVLLALRAQGRSIKTSNLYLDGINAFCSWLVQDKRTGDNPLAHLSGGNVKVDRRHDRQTLSAEQLAVILEVALVSEKSFRGLSGRDRHALYLCATGTGFRAGDVGVLRPEWSSRPAITTWDRPWSGFHCSARRTILAPRRCRPRALMSLALPRHLHRQLTAGKKT